MRARLGHKVPASETEPHLHQEAHDFQLMPTVFATGFLVGLVGMDSPRVLGPRDWPSGEAPSAFISMFRASRRRLPGQTVTVDAGNAPRSTAAASPSR